MSTQDNPMSAWRFRSTGLWHWERVAARTEDVLAESCRGFATLRECVEDARRHGYTVAYEEVSAAVLADSSVKPDRLRPPPCTRY